MSAEGVPVAWAVVDRDGHPASITRSFDDAGLYLGGLDGGVHGPYRVVPLFTHPAAASAEREAFYEAALAYFKSDRERMAAFSGEVEIDGPEADAILEAGKRLGVARKAYAALAAARTTKES